MPTSTTTTCTNCRQEFPEDTMSLNPLSSDLHFLVCQDCKKFLKEWMKMARKRRAKGKIVEEHPLQKEVEQVSEFESFISMKHYE